MMKLEALFTRLLIACVFGLAVAGVAIYLVPGSVANIYDYPPQRIRRQIERVVRELDEHRGKKGTFPSPSSPQALDILVMGDGWHRPLHYSLPNGKPLVESLGRDGIRGGVGLDADISNKSPGLPKRSPPSGKSWPTLWLSLWLSLPFSVASALVRPCF